MLHAREPDHLGSPFKRPLLTLSSKCTNQSAAVALRAWYYRHSRPLVARDGILVERVHIEWKNNDTDGQDSMPIKLISGVSRSGTKVMLGLFNDQSAVILEGVDEHAFDPDRSTYRAFPFVLRLSSIARPADGGKAMTMRMRKVGTHECTLTLGREGEEGSWVSIDAGWTSEIDGFLYEDRQDLKDHLISEACAWLDANRDLPMLALPLPGHPAAGVLSYEGLCDLGIRHTTSPAEYAVPAFLPFRAQTTEQEEQVRELCRDIARWMLDRLGKPFTTIDVEVDSGLLTQKPAKAGPDVRVIAVSPNHQSPELKAVSDRLSVAAKDILSSTLSPYPLEELIGQEVIEYRDRRTWMKEKQIARNFATWDHLETMSAHQRIALRMRFDRFWPEQVQTLTAAA